jgi:hypothetical protein
MITIMECTDCKFCASFGFGFRVFCLNEKFPANEVCKYVPIGEKKADNCGGFLEDDPFHFTSKQLDEAENFSKNKYGEVTYDGIREWCIEKLF